MDTFFIGQIYLAVSIIFLVFFFTNTEPIYKVKLKDITVIHFFAIIIVSLLWLPFVLVAIFFKSLINKN